MQEPNTEQSLPEIGTLKYDQAPKDPKAFVPLNFNGLSLGRHTRAKRLGERLFGGFEKPAAPSAAPSTEASAGSMGVIRYNLPSPIQDYRIQRRRRSAQFQTVGRPLLIAACLAVAVPVGFTAVGQFTASEPVAQASVPADAAPAEASLPAVADAASTTPSDAATTLPPSEAMGSEPANPEPKLVIVKAGDTLGAIAKRHKVSVNELVSFNRLKNAHSLKIGQKLLIPVPAEQLAVANPSETAASEPAESPVLPEPKAQAPLKQAAAPDAQETPAADEVSKAKRAEPTSYTIRSGDTLSSIAGRHGIKTATLASANGLSESDTLSVGQVLKVPPADGIYVKLRSGESLSHLAIRYGVKVEEIQKANQIADPRTLRAGQTIFLPGADPIAKREPRRDRGEFKHASRGLVADIGRAVGHGFFWPTAGKISSTFGERDGRKHTGVDIPRPKGSPIHAARGGVVIAAGWNGDYGKTVDISHGDGVVTRYAHCSQINVKVGDKVEKGEVIGLVGETGRATGPHLHYEVRIGGRPVNPTKFH